MPIHYGRDPRFVPDSPLRAPGGNGRILYEVRPGATARPSEPIKENNPVSETKTELTDELAQETYDQLYIGQSLSLARFAHVLDVYPHELKAKWAGKRLRTGSDAQRAKHQQGQPWEWGEAEAFPQSSESLAKDLGLDIPDAGGKAYANGNLEPDPGPGRRAVPVDEFDGFIAFKGEDDKAQPAPTVTAAGLQKFAAALTDTTLRFVLTDMKAEADPEVNTIRAFLGAELKRQSKDGK